VKRRDSEGGRGRISCRAIQVVCKIAASKEAPVDRVEYPWQRTFFAVLTEVNSEKFLARLVIADDEVFERLLELEGIVGTDEERLALEDTLQSLRLLGNHDCHFRL
jgi:hypothetical protein